MVDSSGELYKSLFDKTEGLLNPKYAEKLVADLVGDISQDFGALSEDGATLAELNEISPKINGLVNGLLEATSQFGILKAEFDDKDCTGARKELMAQPLANMSVYIGNRIKATPLADMMKGIGGYEEITDPLTIALCYGEEFDDWKRDDKNNIQPITPPTTLADLAGESGMSNMINRLSFETVLTATGEPPYNDPMKSVVAYGPESHYDIQYEDNKKVGVTMKQITYTVVDNKLCDDEGVEIEGATFNSSNMTATLSNGDNSTTVYYLQQEGEIYKAFLDSEKKQPANYKKTKIKDLSGDMLSLVEDVYLKDVLVSANNSTHNILLTIAYGAGGYTVTDNGDGTQTVTQTDDAVLRTIGDLRNNNQSMFDEIPLTDIMGTQHTTKLTNFLLYGKKDVHYTLDANDMPVMSRMRIALWNGVLYNGYNEELTEHTLVDGIYNDGETNYQTELTELKQPIRVETAENVFEEKEATVYYLKDMDGKELYFHSTTLGDLHGSNNVVDNLTNRVTVGEIFEEDLSTNIFLRHVEKETIATLPSAINNLRIVDVYEESIYKRNETDTYYIDKFGNDILSEEDYDKRVLVSTWWYLLHDEQKCKEEHAAERTNEDHIKNCIQNYKVDELGTLMTNMSGNIAIATLDELAQDGLIPIDPNNTEDKKLLGQDVIRNVGSYTVAADKIPANKDKLGEFTVDEILIYVGALLDVVNAVNQATGTP